MGKEFIIYWLQIITYKKVLGANAGKHFFFDIVKNEIINFCLDFLYLRFTTYHQLK